MGFHSAFKGLKQLRSHQNYVLCKNTSSGSHA